MGVLRLHSGVWEFRYCPEFKQQHEVRPLIDFPDVDRVYKSAELWPFFLARIPSRVQPQVSETIRREKLDERNSVQMLSHFGKQTISNPFVLEPDASCAVLAK